MRSGKAILFGAIIFVAIIVISLGGSASKADRARMQTDGTFDPPNVRSSSAAPPPVLPLSHDTRLPSPPLSGQTLHPYDLLKNPFKFKNQLILLELNSRPVSYQGRVIQYSGGIPPGVGKQLGLMALRLDRMMSEDQALYHIMGVEAGNSAGKVLGQLVVDLPQGIDELDLGRTWVVEPQGSVEAMNGYGARISLPSVRFWRYQNPIQPDGIRPETGGGAMTTKEVEKP